LDVPSKPVRAKSALPGSSGHGNVVEGWGTRKETSLSFSPVPDVPDPVWGFFLSEVGSLVPFVVDSCDLRDLLVRAEVLQQHQPTMLWQHLSTPCSIVWFSDRWVSKTPGSVV